MVKKIIITLLLLGVLVGGGIFLVIKGKKEKPIEIKPPEIPVKEKEKAKIADYGWSSQNDEEAAAREAVSKMVEKLQKSPDFAFVFSSPLYDAEKLLKEIKNLLPNTKIYGGTSCLGPMTNEGFHGVEKHSVAILGVATPEINFGVAGVDLTNISPKEAGRKAILSAIKDANRKLPEKPTIVFMTPAPGKEEAIIEGIQEVIGKEVPIFGGSSGDNDITGKWKQFVNDKVYNNGLALAVVYTNLKVGYFYEAGYPVTAKKGKVTKAKGRIIYEIDGKPAAEVYNLWTGNLFEEKIKKPGKVWGILAEATLYPLAKVLRTSENELFYLAVHPLSIRPDHSLEVFAEMKDGDEVVLLEGNWEILLNRFRTTPQKALEKFNIKKGEGLFALYTYCAGTMLAIPEKERAKMPLLVKEIIGDIPFVGTFTFGEQGYVPGIGNHHGNLVNSIVIFAPK